MLSLRSNKTISIDKAYEKSPIMNPLPMVQAVSKVSFYSADSNAKDAPIVVPLSKYSELRTLFNNSKADPNPAAWVCSYCLFINLNSGEALTIGLFVTGLDIGALEINRKYYRGSNDTAIKAFFDRFTAAPDYSIDNTAPTSR